MSKGASRKSKLETTGRCCLNGTSRSFIHSQQGQGCAAANLLTTVFIRGEIASTGAMWSSLMFDSATLRTFAA